MSPLVFIGWWFVISAIAGAIIATVNIMRGDRELRRLKREAEQLHGYYDEMRRLNIQH